MSDIIGLDKVKKIAQGHGELLCLCLSGSKAYGLDNSESDDDIVGVYKAPTSQIISIYGTPQETIHKANVGGQPDFTIHEVGKYIKLAASGNPAIIELFFLESLVENETWKTIRDNYPIFLSTNIRRSYGGYALQQLHKKKLREEQGMEGYSPKTRYRDKKHTRHIIRLFIQQRQILETGKITPMLTKEQIDFCLEAQDWDSKQVEEWMNQETLELLKINNNLRPEPDYQKINELIIDIRGL
jgi:hypothetical protein